MRALGTMLCIASTVLVMVLAFVAYRRGEVWGALTFASLLFLLVFGPDLRRQPAEPREASPLDPWLRPEQEG